MLRRSCIWLVATLLCFTLSGAALAARIEQIEERSFPLRGDGFVLVKNVTGKILVQGWEKEEVKMVVTKSIGTLWEERAQEDLDEIEIEVSAQEDRLDIVTHYPLSSWWSQITSLSAVPRVDYQLWLPLGAAVQLESVTGDIRVEERHSKVQAKMTTGDIELLDIWGDIEVYSTSGDIYIERSRGTIMGSSTTGDIKIFEARGAVSSLHTTTGDIWVELEDIDTTASGMSFSATTGDIDLFLPGDVGAKIDAHATTGKISSDFKIAVQGTIGKRELQGTIGEGGITINLKVITGDISLRKL